MNSTFHNRIRLCSIVVMLAWGGPAAAVDDPVRLIPQSALFYIEVSQPSTLLEQARRPEHLAMLERSTAFQSYQQTKPYQDLQSAVAILEQRLGMKWPEATRELAESLHLALEPNTNGLLLIVRARQPELLVKLNSTLIELIEQDATNKGNPSPVKSQEYRGTRGWSFGGNECHAIVDNLLVVSNKSETLKLAIDRQHDAESKSLLNAGDYEQARQRIAPGQVAWGLVRLGPLRLFPQFGKALGSPNNNPVAEFAVGGILDTLREANFVASSLHLEGQQWRLRVAVPQDTTKLTKNRAWYFAPQREQSAGTPLRPKGTIATTTLFRDLGEMWVARDELFDEATTARLSQADTQLGLYFAGRDFGTQILGELKPQMQLVVTRQEFSKDEPVPAVKLPAAALVVEMKHPDEFANHLLLAYQKIVGVINLVGGMAGQPQLLLTSESYQGVSISKATYLVESDTDKQAAPVHYNASPACARVGSRFIFGSNVGIVRGLIDELKNPDAARLTSDNTRFDLDLPMLAAILADNRQALISQNMLSEGHDRQQAEKEVNLLLEVLQMIRTAHLKLAVEPQTLVLEAGIDTR